MNCPYCLADVPIAALPGHLAAHSLAYQETVVILLRGELKQEQEISERLARRLLATYLQRECATNDRDRWQRVACKLWRRYRQRR